MKLIFPHGNNGVQTEGQIGFWDLVHAISSGEFVLFWVELAGKDIQALYLEMNLWH